jgi:regulator of protease activity HflC (stomatin/prohibitin superfamily)
MIKYLIIFGCLIAILVSLSLHTINEGYVGVCYKLGSLQNTILEPGLHFVPPLITNVYQVQVTIQTDYVRDIPCGTNSGVTIKFDKIEVVNQLSKQHVFETVKNYTVDYDRPLIFDKITHEMNQFCSKHSLQEVYIDKFDKLDEILTETLQASLNHYAPGVTIRNIRLSKPIVPREVEENYKKIVEYQTEMLKAKTQQEKDLQLISTENKKVLAKLESDKEQMIMKMESEQIHKLTKINATKNFELAQIEALREKEIARIKADEQKKLSEIAMEFEVNTKTIQKDISYKQGLAELQKIETSILVSKRTSEADVSHYENMKYAEYMNKLMTHNYVTIEVAKSLSNNAKVYYGDSLPKFFNFGMFSNMTI